MSGPLLDSIDLQVEVLEVDKKTLISQENLPPSNNVIKKRVCHAQKVQLERQGKINAELVGHEIDQYCILGDNERQLLNKAIDNMGLSALSYHRIVKISRTIADLAQAPAIACSDIQEALSYRKLERFIP